MKRKIVAIGGGENGRVTLSGARKPYELRKIDEEIIRLTGKTNPNFLFVGHAQNSPEYETLYFNTMKAIYGEIFDCDCKIIMKKDLVTISGMTRSKLIEWADVIYVGGGDTKGMIDFWHQTGFDKDLNNAYIKGKVLCGVSAGANCWFNMCSSDSLKIQSGNEKAPLIGLKCLNFINAFFAPHCNVANENENRLLHMKEALKECNLVGIGISNCCAIEIINEEYRLICCDASNYGINAYGIKAYYKNGIYITENIDNSIEFKQLSQLLKN